MDHVMPSEISYQRKSFCLHGFRLVRGSPKQKLKLVTMGNVTSFSKLFKAPFIGFGKIWEPFQSLVLQKLAGHFLHTLIYIKGFLLTKSVLYWISLWFTMLPHSFIVALLVNSFVFFSATYRLQWKTSFEHQHHFATSYISCRQPNTQHTIVQT